MTITTKYTYVLINHNSNKNTKLTIKYNKNNGPTNVVGGIGISNGIGYGYSNR